VKARRVKEGLKQRRELFEKVAKSSRDDGKSINRPGSLNAHKTGGAQSSERYSHRSRASKRSRAAVSAR
jgi:hypothetical protein